jgi:flagellar basal-body rod protein FlgB
MAVHAGQMQAVAAENVANADTPGFQARRLPSFAENYANPDAPLRATRRTHLHGSQGGSAVTPTADGTAMTDPNGNSVSLENEMLHSLEAKRQHDRALAIYKSSLSILRTSASR